MQLLEHGDTGEIRLTENLPIDKTALYEMTSHIWGPEEVLFRDMTDSTDKNRARYPDILFGRGSTRPMVLSWVNRKLSVKMVSAGAQDPRWIHDDFEVRTTLWLGTRAKSLIYYVECMSPVEDSLSNR